MEKTENESMWRRQHQEGPIDDRWTNLRLDVDEGIGDIKIVESRKEWHLGSSKSQRTFYTTPIVFPHRSEQDPAYMCLPLASAASASAASLLSSASSNNSSNFTRSIGTSTPTPFQKTFGRNLSGFPDDPLLRLLQEDDHPNHTHPGDDGSTQPTPTLSKSRLRYYHCSSSTFLDLVDDPSPTDWRGMQRLRLRGGSRRLGPPLRFEYEELNAGYFVSLHLTSKSHWIKYIPQGCNLRLYFGRLLRI